MILWNEKIKKSQDIINAVINQLMKGDINTDGVVETFNNGKEQGCVLKIFDKYNPNLDLCFWIYLPNKRNKNNQVSVIVGKQTDCDSMNMWSNDPECYTFEDSVAREMHKKTRDFILDTIKENMNKTRDIRL